MTRTGATNFTYPQKLNADSLALTFIESDSHQVLTEAGLRLQEFQADLTLTRSPWESKEDPWSLLMFNPNYLVVWRVTEPFLAVNRPQNHRGRPDNYQNVWDSWFQIGMITSVVSEWNQAFETGTTKQTTVSVVDSWVAGKACRDVCSHILNCQLKSPL